jgi:hypothetical protein
MHMHPSKTRKIKCAIAVIQHGYVKCLRVLIPSRWKLFMLRAAAFLSWLTKIERTCRLQQSNEIDEERAGLWGLKNVKEFKMNVL